MKKVSTKVFKCKFCTHITYLLNTILRGIWECLGCDVTNYDPKIKRNW